MQGPTSTAALAEPGEWAATLGNRLKYLQANLAEETPENRQNYLEEELRRALQNIPASKRGLYLDALAQRFPTWDLGSVVVTSPSAVTQQSPDDIINSFLQLVPELSGERRDTVKQRLAGLGILLTTNKPIDGDALSEVQLKLKLAPEDAIDPQRLGKLFAALADVMITMDQLAWNVWRSAAPKSAIRRDSSHGDLRLMLRRALSGDVELSTGQVQKQLEATRQLVAGLLAGLGPAGKNFARRFHEHYAPDAIREVVRTEGGGSGLFANMEAKCWKKYTELASELTDATIENDIQNAVVKYAEDLIRGSQR